MNICMNNVKIELGEKEDIPNILTTINYCVQDLEKRNILQWNQDYPNKDIINIDIFKKNLYLIKYENRCLALVVINEEHDEQWKSIKWSSYVKKPLIVHRLIVHPDYQHMGFGKKMIKFIIEYSIKHNYDSIRFDVFSKNENALNLYNQLNCTKKGEVLFPNTKDVFYCYELIL